MPVGPHEDFTYNGNERKGSNTVLVINLLILWPWMARIAANQTVVDAQCGAQILGGMLPDFNKCRRIKEV